MTSTKINRFQFKTSASLLEDSTVFYLEIGITPLKFRIYCQRFIKTTYKHHLNCHSWCLTVATCFLTKSYKLCLLEKKKSNVRAKTNKNS